MSGYQGLINNIEDLRKKVAIFRRVVLHSHSPASNDWRPGDLKKKEAFEGWSIEETAFVDALKDTNIELLAITDHMKCGLACRISQAGIKKDLVVLPGMEVRIRPVAPWNTFTVHLLAIFPEGYALEKACKIFSNAIPEENKRNGKEEEKGVELKEFVKKVHDCGGLCIAAHIDTDRGVRKVFRQLGCDGIVFYNEGEELTDEEERQISDQFKDWILSAGFDAIEVGKSEDKKHYKWLGEINGEKFTMPALLTSDAHCVEDIGREDRFTYAKMTEVGFADLKKAFQFADTRIRFPKDLPRPTSPRILGLQISTGTDKGFFKDLKLAFSDNLTCLIGPRGSGKSTIIETLRYIFGYNQTLDTISEGEELVEKIRELQQATLSSCIVRVVYSEVNGDINIFEATYDKEQDYVTRIYTVGGEEKEIANIEASGRFPLRLFGWSEIETLGREAKRQRELLDRLVLDLHDKLETRRSIRLSLSEIREQIASSVIKLEGIIKRNGGEVKRYSEHKADFERYNTDDVKELFSEHDEINTKLAVLEAVKGDIAEQSSQLEKLVGIDLLKSLNDLFKDKADQIPDGIKKWWLEKKGSLEIDNKQVELRGHVEKAQNVLKKLADQIDLEIASITKEREETGRKIRENIGEEDSKQVSADLRQNTNERLQRVETLRKEYTAEWKNLAALLEQWKKACGSLVALQDEITGKRIKQKEEIEARLNQFETEAMKISIDFQAGKDRSEFKDFLEGTEFFSGALHGHYKQSRWPEKFSTLFTPVELALAVLEGEEQGLVRSITIKEQPITVDEEIAQKILTTLHPFSEDEDAKLPIVEGDKLDKVLRVAEIEWDDAETILLNDESVEHKSPGQRSSAMLPLIALAETAPLVIDQPEDNLDNQLVGKVLVKILAELKEKRQIIVATHNPNIVVSGDAEQVIVLDALGSKEGVCKVSGSIDSPEIVKSVIDIMEGGREAFVTRHRRYGLD